MTWEACDLRITAVDAARDVPLRGYFDARARELSETRANLWVKSLRKAVVDGVPFRERFTCRGDSLWWFAEIYLHKERAINEALGAIYALEALIEREQPRRIEPAANGEVDPILALVGPQVAARHGVAWGGNVAFKEFGERMERRVAARSRVLAARAAALRLRPRQRRAATRKVALAAFVHSAFWRADSGEEGYIGPVLEAIADAVGPSGMEMVGLGPRTNFRARSWRQRFREFRDPMARAMPWTPVESFAAASSMTEARKAWRERGSVCRALWASEDLRARSFIEGCDLWPLVKGQLAGVAYLQFPWSVEAMDLSAAALDVLSPSAVITYAEAGGWGRALVLEARRRGVRSAGLQHGFIYRHWLNYLHQPDEMAPSGLNPADRGFPRPDLTLLHDRFALEHLVENGRFPESSLAVTGSHKLEAFSEAARRLTEEDRARIRAEAGCRQGERLVVVAAKFRQIESAFSDLVRCVSRMPGVHLVVKCHPAETPAPYERAAAGVERVKVAPATADLARLVASADLLVTVNSTAAIEAMVLNVPALVLALPSNLSPFVEAGAMEGVAAGAPAGPALEGILYDEERRERLRAGRRAFLDSYGIVADGRATARAVEAILRLAGEGTTSRAFR